ncbi:porin, partial [Enterobacter asburiae]
QGVVEVFCLPKTAWPPTLDLVNYFEVGATYYFNKNMSTYVDYIINQIDSDNKLGVGSADTVAVGIVYQF